MLKLGRVHRQTRGTFVDPTAMMIQMREVPDFKSLQSLTAKNWQTPLALANYPEDGRHIPMGKHHNQTVHILVRKRFFQELTS